MCLLNCSYYNCVIENDAFFFDKIFSKKKETGFLQNVYHKLMSDKQQYTMLNSWWIHLLNQECHK